MCCPCAAGLWKRSNRNEDSSPLLPRVRPRPLDGGLDNDMHALVAWTPLHYSSKARSLTDQVLRRQVVTGSVEKAMVDQLNLQRDSRPRTNSKIQAHSGLTRLDCVLRHHSNRDGDGRPIEDFYEKIAVIGQGAFGKVTKWRTKNAGGDHDDRARGEEVAVKHIGWKSTFGTSWNAQSDQIDELKQELTMLIVLDNPFIIEVREWFEHPVKGFHFVMELCDGGSLQSLLEEVTREPAKIPRVQRYKECLRRYFRQVTYALGYLHGIDPPIVHRDLKPDNVLLKKSSEGDTGTVKLIDFGLTIGNRAGDRVSTNETWRQGTQVFMAPEQFLEPAGNFTESMDIWALGIILGWTASALYLGSLQHPMLQAHEGREFDVKFVTLLNAYRDFAEEGISWRRELLSGHVSHRFLDLMDRILVFDPDNRLQASDIIDHAWVAQGDPAKAAMLMDHSSLFDNIRSYNTLDKFERIVLNMVAKNACAHAGSLVSDRILALDRAFRALDVNHDGMLSKEELVQGFETFHGTDNTLSTDEISSVFDEMDVDGSGLIDYSEFLAASIGSAILRDEDSVSSAFRGLDCKNRHMIFKEDLVAAIGEHPATEFCNSEGRESFTYADFRKLVMKVAGKRSIIPVAENVKRRSLKLLTAADQELLITNSRMSSKQSRQSGE